MTVPPAASSDARARHVTAVRLWRALLLTTLVGALLPLMPWLARQGEADLSSWRHLRDGRPGLQRFFAEHPGADPVRLAPALRALPWDPPGQNASMRYYWSFAASDAVLLALLLLARRRVRAGLGAAADWLHAPGNTRARRIVFGWLGAIAFCFLTKTPLGFWIPAGIGGWTYAGRTVELELPPPDLPAPTAEERAWLERGLAPANARWLPGPGTLSGPVVLLHFEGGEVWPANHELLDLPKYPYLFGDAFGAVRRPAVLLEVFRNALRFRRRGARFLLPAALSYPNHRAYPIVDYRGTPPPEELERVTCWRVTISIDAEHRVTLMGAERTLVIDGAR